ncbi:hypothetical protein ACU686_00880 [Yinghuangia aomiensis]
MHSIRTLPLSTTMRVGPTLTVGLRGVGRCRRIGFDHRRPRCQGRAGRLEAAAEVGLGGVVFGGSGFGGVAAGGGGGGTTGAADAGGDGAATGFAGSWFPPPVSACRRVAIARTAPATTAA